VTALFNATQVVPQPDPHTQIAVGLEQLVILTRMTFAIETAEGDKQLPDLVASIGPLWQARFR
jgi:hypothetical protein